MCRNKYRILFPNFFFFFSQNKITEFLICLVKLKGTIKELWEIRRKLKKKLEDSYYSQDEQWLLNWRHSKLGCERDLKGCQMLGLSVRRLQVTAPGVSSAAASQGFMSSVLALPHRLCWFLLYSFVPCGQGLNQLSFKWHPEAGKKEHFFSHCPFLSRT